MAARNATSSGRIASAYDLLFRASQRTAPDAGPPPAGYGLLRILCQTAQRRVGAAPRPSAWVGLRIGFSCIAAERPEHLGSVEPKALDRCSRWTRAEPLVPCSSRLLIGAQENAAVGRLKQWIARDQDLEPTPVEHSCKRR